MKIRFSGELALAHSGDSGVQLTLLPASDSPKFTPNLDHAKTPWRMVLNRGVEAQELIKETRTDSLSLEQSLK